MRTTMFLYNRALYIDVLLKFQAEKSWWLVLVIDCLAWIHSTNENQRWEL